MGLITPRGYGLFLSKTHFIEIINIFSMPFKKKLKLKNLTLDLRICNFSSYEDDLSWAIYCHI